MVVEAYLETVAEARQAGVSALKAHMEGIIAAAMLVAATAGIEDEDAKKMVVAMVNDDPDIKPGQA
jgi:tellurite resistance protein